MLVGSGFMARGIATLFAGAGLEAVMYNPLAGAGEGAPEGVRLSRVLPDERPDLIIESVFEILDLKIDVLCHMEEAYGETVILASNTSGLPLDEMAVALERPQRFLGLHFFTPAEVSPLVEVVRVAATDDGVVQAVVDLLAGAGREALMVERPVVGFLWNRLQHAILHEAYYLIENGIARPEDIDNIAKRLLGPRFCVSGLVESKDIGGLEMHARAQDAIVPHLNASRTPSPILNEMVRRGDTGIRSGRGFYDWQGQDADAIVADTAHRLRRLNAFLDGESGGGE